MMMMMMIIDSAYLAAKSAEQALNNIQIKPDTHNVHR